ncbi:hypothetical protein [Agitococcus lubricus]|uniref:Uncharacterized protein n=1 Tax=Agitococcus lubricus TaxID=1077255 RepID=A0A2T5J255_9GAMM|nr:hypothetical protein [Agitococcus lubricus]PTQ90512.1 hypothetical protein C8N29_103267 [Agitococcus lubricus]
MLPSVLWIKVFIYNSGMSIEAIANIVLLEESVVAHFLKED